MQILENSRRDLLARALDSTGCGALMRVTPLWQGVLILNYHRVGQPADSLLDRNLWSATAEGFASQMRLLRQDFDVIGLDDLDDAFHHRRGRHVLVTFDDGYHDNYDVAYPILKEHRIPAVFFVTTGYLDRPSLPWWDEIAWMVRTARVPRFPKNPWFTEPVLLDEPDRETSIRKLLAVYKRLSGLVTDEFLNFIAESLRTGRATDEIARGLWLTWDQVREMRAGGMSFGGHTVNHPILSSLPAESQRFEISECKRRIEQELNKPVRAFSYPVGGRESFDATTRQLLAEAGYQWGFTYTGGYCKGEPRDRLTIARTAIELDISPSVFRAMTSLPQVFA